MDVVNGSMVTLLLPNVIVCVSAVCSPSAISTFSAVECVSFVLNIVWQGNSSHPHVDTSTPSLLTTTFVRSLDEGGKTKKTIAKLFAVRDVEGLVSTTYINSFDAASHE